MPPVSTDAPLQTPAGDGAESISLDSATGCDVPAPAYFESGLPGRGRTLAAASIAAEASETHATSLTPAAAAARAAEQRVAAGSLRQGDEFGRRRELIEAVKGAYARLGETAPMGVYSLSMETSSLERLLVSLRAKMRLGWDPMSSLVLTGGVSVTDASTAAAPIALAAAPPPTPGAVVAAAEAPADAPPADPLQESLAVLCRPLGAAGGGGGGDAAAEAALSHLVVVLGPPEAGHSQGSDGAAPSSGSDAGAVVAALVAAISLRCGPHDAVAAAPPSQVVARASSLLALLAVIAGEHPLSPPSPSSHTLSSSGAAPPSPLVPKPLAAAPPGLVAIATCAAAVPALLHALRIHAADAPLAAAVTGVLVAVFRHAPTDSYDRRRAFAAGVGGLIDVLRAHTAQRRVAAAVCAIFAGLCATSNQARDALVAAEDGGSISLVLRAAALHADSCADALGALRGVAEGSPDYRRAVATSPSLTAVVMRALRSSDPGVAAAAARLIAAVVPSDAVATAAFIDAGAVPLLQAQAAHAAASAGAEVDAATPALRLLSLLQGYEARVAQQAVLYPHAAAACSAADDDAPGGPLRAALDLLRKVFENAAEVGAPAEARRPPPPSLVHPLPLPSRRSTRWTRASRPSRLPAAATSVSRRSPAPSTSWRQPAGARGAWRATARCSASPPSRRWARSCCWVPQWACWTPCAASSRSLPASWGRRREPSHAE